MQSLSKVFCGGVVCCDGTQGADVVIVDFGITVAVVKEMRGGLMRRYD